LKNSFILNYLSNAANFISKSIKAIQIIKIQSNKAKLSSSVET